MRAEKCPYCGLRRDAVEGWLLCRSVVEKGYEWRSMACREIERLRNELAAMAAEKEEAHDGKD